MFFRTAGRPGKDIFRDALGGLKEPAAILGADLRVLFANDALLLAQGCTQAGGACRRTGRPPCPECMTADLNVLSDAAYVPHAGRMYERTVSSFGGNAQKFAVLWHDITAGADSAAVMKKQYDKMRRDIFHARSIQYSLLPRELPKADGYSFASLYKPSEEMSGDIFDFVRIGRDNMAFYIADVAGHGVTAAMLTIFFSTAVRLEMKPTDMPGKVFARIHNRFMGLQLEEQHYITAFLGRLELSTGRLFWSNAGHICPPVLLDRAGRATQLEMAGLPICRWFAEQDYETQSGYLEPGGRLVLYSDGLEAQWHGSGAQGDLGEAVGDIMRDTAPAECLEAIWRTAGSGIAARSISDDTTLLMVSRDIGSGNEVQG